MMETLRGSGKSGLSFFLWRLTSKRALKMCPAAGKSISQEGLVDMRGEDAGEVCLTTEVEIFCHGQEAGQQLVPWVSERLVVGLEIPDDGLGFLRVGSVMGNFFGDVGKIVPDLDIMDSRPKLPFQEPGLELGLGHETKGVRLGDPFEVAGHIPAFHGEDEFVL
jgi:hypothetical protein